MPEPMGGNPTLDTLPYRSLKSTHHLPPYDGQRGEKGIWLQCQGSDSELEPCPPSNSPRWITLRHLSHFANKNHSYKSSKDAINMNGREGLGFISIPYCSFINTCADNISVPELSRTQEHKMRGSCWCSSCVGRQQSLTCHLHLCTRPSQSWHSAARLSPLCKHYCCLKNAGRGVSPLSLNQKKTQLNPGKSRVVLSKH